MKIRFLILSILLILGVSFISYQVTHALFSDSAQSSDNTFAAASSFPTATPSATPTFTPTPTSTPSANAGDVVINEIMWMGSQGNASDEWIELRNMTSNTINLSNWFVDNLGTGINGITIPPSSSISANGFFLIANDFEEDSVISVDPDLVTSSVSLQNSGEQLILRSSAGGTIIDTANATSSAWFAGSNVHPRKSMARKDPPGDGTIASNWFTSTISANLDPTASESATPKAANGL